MTITYDKPIEYLLDVKDIKEISLPVGNYYITSDYLEPTEFEVENKNQEFIVQADYTTKELKVAEKKEIKNQVR